MNKLEKLKVDIQKIVTDSTSPILCWSGGSDSTFLLSITKNLGYNLPALCFNHFWNKFQLEFIQKIVQQYKTQCFFYRPSRLDFENNSIIAYYSVGDRELPVIIDVIDGNTCGLEVGNRAIKGVVPHFLWDKIMVGTKSCDAHPLVKNFQFTNFPNIECPLWDWSDEEVMETTKLLGFPYDERVYDQGNELADTGNFHGCMACVGNKEVFCPKEGRIIQGRL